ncbi:MAG: thiamine phosphate synthase [Acidobacteriota bacterium]
MPLALHSPLIYLITSGQTTVRTTPPTEEFRSVLKQVRKAVAARIDLVQLREKSLRADVLFQLATSAAVLTKGSATKLLINDRCDIAAAAGADGVHLARTSLPTVVVRQSFGADFLIGVSTHSLEEARLARSDGADFVVFGPVFETPSKKKYGDALGLSVLASVCAELSTFPVLAIGGVEVENVIDCVRAGAQGVAAIGMLQEPDRLADITHEIRRSSRRD